MYPAKDQISRRQLMGVGVLCMLSLLIRRVPAQTISLAGSGAWLSTLLAGVPVTLLGSVVFRLMKGRWGRQGLGHVMLEVYGGFGRVLLLIYAAWFVFLAAFTLRSSADRFITTIYPSSSPAFFVVTTLLACLPAVTGSLRALSRSAMLFRPILLGVLALVFGFALANVDMTGLWQPSQGREVNILYGTVDIANLLAVSLYLSFFGAQVRATPDTKSSLAWLAVVIGIAFTMVVVTVGTLGAELAAKIHNPFFAVVRDLTLFGTIEHVEAIVVTVWVFSDFVYLAALLHMAGLCLCLCFSVTPPDDDPGLLELRHGRCLPLLCAILAGAAALLLAPTSSDLPRYAQLILPVGNLALSFGLLPLTALVGLLRRKL